MSIVPVTGGDDLRLLGSHLSALLARVAGDHGAAITAAVEQLTAATSAGHVCVDLHRAAPPPALDHEGWMAALRQSGVAGAPGEFKPLILDGTGRLYLHRYWNYEQKLTSDLRARATAELQVDEVRLREGLRRLFGTVGGETDWQQVAAAIAVLKQLCVISGGPGTGKTTAVVRLLALLAEQSPVAPRIGLAAPTGKAAARMQETVRAARETLPVADAIKAAIPDAASTLHRLLGGAPDSLLFRHNRENPLALDVLVVDEASMVDMALMTKLVDALAPGARLILIGDKDQLASVQAGAVLADICSRENLYSPAFASRLGTVTGMNVPTAGGVRPPLADCAALLDRSHRFAADSGIARLSRRVREGDVEAALMLLRNAGAANQEGDLRWFPDAKLIPAALVGRLLVGLKEYFDAVDDGDPARALAAFDRFRILTAHREGLSGARRLNEMIERVLADKGRLPAREHWYPGRPVLISRNHHELQLYNGDLGIAMRASGARDLRVYFAAAGGGIRALAPARLPAHETAYALTVHKAQGSEFDEVLLILPDAASMVLSRELLYTGITRARRRTEIYGSAEVVAAAVGRVSQRDSGLRDALWT
ncbi:MAG TPA: exodeoxyribonuclease V subunit alpha [Gammaproteobacteria bacterium]|nr:exodeoxyribonuclease V subunit alpha [Gammaproteobacteria bacterium]